MFSISTFLGFNVEAAEEAPQSFTIDGKLYSDSAATTPLTDIVALKIQILNPSQTCIIYEESQSVDTTNSAGNYTIQIGQKVTPPAGKRSSGDSNNGMATILSNTTASISGKLLSDGTTPCTYNPTSGDTRYVKFTMTPATDGIARTTTTNLLLNSVPTAIVSERAENLRGYTPSQFIQVNGTTAALTQANLESLFTTTGMSRLTTLTSVPATNYVQAAANGSIGIPSVASDPATSLSGGQIWYNSSSNTLKYYDAGSASVKSISTGAGGGGALSALTAATGTNTIDSQNFSQAWNWSTATTQSPLSISANSLTTGSLLSATTSSGSLNSTNGLLNVANTGASTNGVVARIQSNATSASGLTVLANGNIGVETTSPRAKLDVVGTMQVGSSIDTIAIPYTFLVSSADTATDSFGNIMAFSTDATAVDKGGHIVMGGRYNSINSSANFASIAGRKENGTLGDMSGYMAIATTGSNSVNAERMRITSSGYVGIGTTSPVSKLDIRATSEVAMTAFTSTGLAAVNAQATAGTGYGVYSNSVSGTAIFGRSTSSYGVQGVSKQSTSGFFQADDLFNTAPTLVTRNYGPNTADLFQAQSFAGSSLVNITSTGNVGVGTSSPSAKLDVNQVTAGSAAFLAESGGTNFLKILNPAGGITTTYSAANSVLYVGSDTVTGRSINASGTVNASGADFAEWVEWYDSKIPQMGSVVLYKGSYVVISSPLTAAFVGNDNNNFRYPVLVAFAGQLPVLVRGKVKEGDLIVANGDGTASAVPRDHVTMDQASKGVGTAWASSHDSGLKRINVAIGIGLAGNGGRDLASVKAQASAWAAKLETENAELKARLTQQEKELAAIKKKLGM